MKRILLGLVGAVLGYLTVTLFLVWFLEGTPLAFALIAGMIGGFVLGYRQGELGPE